MNAGRPRWVFETVSVARNPCCQQGEANQTAVIRTARHSRRFSESDWFCSMRLQLEIPGSRSR